MKYDLQEFEKRVELGLLRKSQKDGLILFGYTDRCTFERAWDEYTTIARGIILDKEGNVIAKPFGKFFNLFETEETSIKNLPNLPYTVSEKVDGSLGIVFNYKGEWRVATRGSFYSDQAVMAQKLLKDYDLSDLNQNITLLVEIIYPENKMIVNYGNESKLVLLAAFNRDDGEELDKKSLKIISDYEGFELAKSFDYTIEEMIALQQTLPKDNEGFVVRFENGLRVKIKSKEYLRIAKLMSSLSPIALWETMSKGKVDTTYLQQLPEELRSDYEPYVVQLEKSYFSVYCEIMDTVKKHKLNTTTEDWRKYVGLYLKQNNVKHSSAIFPYLLQNRDALNKYIMKQIRPTGNEMRVLE